MKIKVEVLIDVDENLVSLEDIRDKSQIIVSHYVNGDEQVIVDDVLVEEIK